MSYLPEQAVIPVVREAGSVSVETKLLSRLREALFERDFDAVTRWKFAHAESVIEQAPFALIGLGALSCMRAYETGAVLNFLDLIIAAGGETRLDRAVDAMASKMMSLFSIGKLDAYDRLLTLALRCGIFSALVADVSEAWLERHEEAR